MILGTLNFLCKRRWMVAFLSGFSWKFDRRNWKIQTFWENSDQIRTHFSILLTIKTFKENSKVEIIIPIVAEVKVKPVGHYVTSIRMLYLLHFFTTDFTAGNLFSSDCLRVLLLNTLDKEIRGLGIIISPLTKLSILLRIERTISIFWVTNNLGPHDVFPLDVWK